AGRGAPRAARPRGRPARGLGRGRAVRALSARRAAAVVGALAALLALSLLAALASGPSGVGAGRVLAVLLGGETAGPAADIVWRVRLPRVALGALVGAALSGSGVLFQALLRNPLADPFVLGVSGRAAPGGIAGLPRRARRDRGAGAREVARDRLRRRPRGGVRRRCGRDGPALRGRRRARAVLADAAPAHRRRLQRLRLGGDRLPRLARRPRGGDEHL